MFNERGKRPMNEDSNASTRSHPLIHSSAGRRRRRFLFLLLFKFEICLILYLWRNKEKKFFFIVFRCLFLSISARQPADKIKCLLKVLSLPVLCCRSVVHCRRRRWSVRPLYSCLAPPSLSSLVCVCCTVATTSEWVRNLGQGPHSLLFFLVR